MSAIYEDVRIDVVVPRLKVSTKKQVFHYLAKEIAGQTGLAADAIVRLLMASDRDSRPVVGGGMVIAPLKLKDINKTFKVLMTLEEPVEYRALDNQPVDIICGVISPQKDGPLHLRRLSRVSRFLSNQQLQEKLRMAMDETEIRAVLTNPDGWLQQQAA